MPLSTWNLLVILCSGSGTELNVNKTKGLWLGKWKQRQVISCGFTWQKDNVKMLGVFVGNNATPDENWGPRLNKIQCTLNY